MLEGPVNRFLGSPQTHMSVKVAELIKVGLSPPKETVDLLHVVLLSEAISPC